MVLQLLQPMKPPKGSSSSQAKRVQRQQLDFMNGSLSIETTTPLFDEPQTVSNNVMAVQLSLAGHSVPASVGELPPPFPVFSKVLESYA